MWMAEADALCRQLDPGRAGPAVQRVRPLRAGDYSFNQIGPTGLYMLLSNIPIEERKQRGYYAVGGCGGNIAWHTPDDLMPVADLEILRRDLAVYVTTIVRILNAPLHPFDYAAAVDEIRGAIAEYQHAAGSEVDFAPIARRARRRSPRTSARGGPKPSRASAGRLATGRTAPTQRVLRQICAPARAAQLRARRAVRPRSRAQVRRGAATRSGGEPRRRRRRS